MDKKPFLEKNAQAVMNFFGSPYDKRTRIAHEGIAELVNSMGDDEYIMYAFPAASLFINQTSNGVFMPRIIITNKRFYYSGTEYGRIFAYKMAGNIDITDIHAISTSDDILKNNDIRFEVKNENYTVTPVNNANKVKEILEEVRRMSNETKNATVIQQVSSADELLKFKQLLDSGIITQEEFDSKKKQLLGL